MYSAFTSYQLNCQDMKLHLDMAESNRRAHYIHVSPYIKWDGKNKYERRTKYLNYKVIKKFDGTCSTIGHSRIPNLSLWENIFCFFFVSLESKKKIRIHYPHSFNRFSSSCHDVVKLFSSRAAIVTELMIPIPTNNTDNVDYSPIHHFLRFWRSCRPGLVPRESRVTIQ